MIVGSICARGGSKGVPRKALRIIADIPLIAHTIACAKECELLGHVFVSTDDVKIAEIAQKYGAEVPFLRPQSLAGDDSPKWDVFRHLVTTCEELLNTRIEILVDLDVCVPLRPAETITECIQKLQSSGADLVVTAYEADRNPYFNMVEFDEDGTVSIVKKSANPVHNRQSANPVYALSPAVYAIRRDVLWQYDHWSQARMEIQLIPRDIACDIDTELDLKIVQFLMEQDRK